MTYRFRRRAIGEAALAAAAAALAIAAAGITVRGAPGDEVGRAIRQIVIIWLPAVAGIYALRNPQTRRFGLGLIAIGFLWSLTALGYADANPEYSIGRVCSWLIFPALVYVILVYPERRLHARPDRTLYRAAVALVTVAFV